MGDFKLTEALMDEWGISLDDFEAMFPDLEAELDDDDNVYWMIDGTDANEDGIPDIIASLVTNPHNTNASQGGILG